MTTPISFNERFARLQLFRSRGVGPMTYAQLVQKFGSAIEAIQHLPELAAAKGRRNVVVADTAEIEKEWAEADRLGVQFVTLGEKDYPRALAAIADPPPVLGARGNVLLLEKTIVAIVGARNASAAALSFTRDLAAQLGEEGLVVVSGLARGIDGAAHQGSIDRGTIAVLAGGPDSIYPPQHKKLYGEIAERGLIISEQPMGMTARAQDFPKRNRIVSGLCRGVVVVEAAERSGTLITARLANEQGRDVFAVPGSPLDPRCRGTNDLIKKGAILVQDADDVLAELASGSSSLFEPEISPLVLDDDKAPEGLRALLLSLLSYDPIHRDILIAESGSPAPQVSAALLDLVLDGDATEEAGGRYALAAVSGGK